MRQPLLILSLLSLIACNTSTDKATENQTDHTHLLDSTAQEAETADTTTIPSDEELQDYTIDTTGLTPEPAAAVKILIEGRFHKHEVWQGAEHKQWMGLVYQDSTFQLLPAAVTVSPFFDPVLDSKAAKTMSGREVGGAIPGTLFFLTGMPQLKAGSIDTVGFSSSVVLPNTSLHLRFRDKTYTLEAKGDSVQEESSESYSLKNYSWRISGTRNGRKISQELASDTDFESAIYVLLWAGDLDRDGIPDLLADLSNHYNASEVTLFLSSKADKGKLYKKVAAFRSEAYPATAASDSLQAPVL
ncbi:hypothetical protein [Pontibacter roseus]|uniref:hypothetical protein n=1 Tax=Pontibacter roseus TaxID=336989 RepID=UPI00037EAE7C|nr:hypothetical protein [Pontibacter roseus]